MSLQANIRANGPNVAKSGSKNMPNQDNIHAKTGSKNKPNQTRKTAKSGSNYTPNKAQTARQIRLKLHAKSGSNYTLNQAQTARQIRLKLHAKSGSNCAPNQAPIRAACYRYAAKKREKKHERAYPISQTLLRRKGNSPKI